MTDGAWKAENSSPLEAQETGVSLATSGVAGARLLRCTQDWEWPIPITSDDDFCLLFVLSGGAAFVPFGGEVERLSSGSSVTIPAGQNHALDDIAADTLLLEITASVPPSEKPHESVSRRVDDVVEAPEM